MPDLQILTSSRYSMIYCDTYHIYDGNCMIHDTYHIYDGNCHNAYDTRTYTYHFDDENFVCMILTWYHIYVMEQFRSS